MNRHLRRPARRELWFTDSGGTGTPITEYAGDYPQGGSPSQFWNSGGVYHLTKTQQVDFHVAVGLNHNAPSYVIGPGYSLRIDGLFRQ